LYYKIINEQTNKLLGGQNNRLVVT